MKDFEEEGRSVEDLLLAIQQYFNGDRKELYSISFKYQRLSTITIKNFFTVDEVYKSLLSYFDINQNNFKLRKDEILKGVNNLKFNKGGEFVKIRH